jgi:hypothetical protein
VRFIEIELDSVVCRALLDERAPETASVLWDALPLEGEAVHTYGSGEMIRLLEPLPLRDLSPEGQISFQHPGSVVYYSPAKELAICYGSARFAGGLPVSPLAEMEGDLSEFSARANRLIHAGSKQLAVRRAADQTTPFRYPTWPGSRIELSVGDATATAVLRADLSPVTVAEFARRLPIAGSALSDMFGGQITRFMPSSGLDLAQTREDRNHRASTGLWPGYLYWFSEERSLVLCYGDGLFVGGPWTTAVVTPLASLEGDWGELRSRLSHQYRTGAAPFSFR